MSTPLLDAFELLATSEQLPPRLDAAAAELAKLPGFVEEKAWLDAARRRVAPTRTREGTGDLLVRVLRLPELEPVKGDRVRLLQGAAVDALEHLHSAITFAGSPRSPLLEALYFKLKIPVLRRCDRDEFERFVSDFEKRLTATYTRRMLANETYAPAAGPALERLHAAFATWRGVLVTDPLEESVAQALREELLLAARGLEIPWRQARLLAQAALAPLKELEAAAALAQKAKKKGARGAESEEDTHRLLEQDPPDPSEPTPEERAELDDVQDEQA
jgi:hypothetical protein